LTGSPEKGFRSGYVTIIGRPNVGKSTLLNTVLGEKVAIVTPKPQTTRNRLVGIKTNPEAQIVFIDTPGIHRPRKRLGEFMVRQARESLLEVDIVLFMVEPRMPERGELEILDILSHLRGDFSDKNRKGKKGAAIFLLINKIDTMHKADLLPIIDRYTSLYIFDEIIPVSALKGDGLDRMVHGIIDHLPQGPKYYPDDIFTDQLERFMAAEIIREKIMKLTSDEIPYSVAVEIVQWSEKEKILVIDANIYVEKESQKGIIIGKAGKHLKAIGAAARDEIEKLLNARVYLALWVKVKEKWRDDIMVLRDLGYR
jgi:GTP-binding protein Era